MSQKPETLDENQSIPLQLCQAYWEQSLPQVMDMNTGDPPCLDQMVYQRVAKTPSDITPWSWAEPLTLSVLRWTTTTAVSTSTTGAPEASIVTTDHASDPGSIPMRIVRVGPQSRCGVVGLETTEKFRVITEQLARTFGDFQANRFFSFPAMLDTKSMALLVEAVRTSTGSKLDEAAYVRCMLLSEALVNENKMRKLSHIASHIAIDLRIGNIVRNMGTYGRAAPNGLMFAIDLGCYAALTTQKIAMSEENNPNFGIDTWGSLTAVVPVLLEHSGSRALMPYSLSFVTTAYWTQRVGYSLDLIQIGVDHPRTARAGCVPKAAQAMISGPTNILFVVIDAEIHPSDTMSLDVGGINVSIVGRSTAKPPRADKTVRSVLDRWMGGPQTSGVPPGRQRDAYEALQMLNIMVGTTDVFDTALNVATELSRSFSCNATVAVTSKESCGLTCVADDVASGKRFGMGGPRAKKLGPWEDTAAVSSQLSLARYYFLAPSGMMCEGYGSVLMYGNGAWPQLDGYSSTTSSVVVSEADHAVRMARALDLVLPGRASVTPRQELSLTLWLSGNALLLSGATFSAYLSFGLDWAMLNGLLTLSSEMTTSLKKLVPICTNQRVQNSIEAKRQLYVDGKRWAGYEEATRRGSSNQTKRSIKDVAGFPLPMFMLRAITSKLGVILSRPPVEGTYFDIDEDEDSAPVGVVTTAQRNWLFVPIVCDTIDLVRSRFQVFTNAPTGKEEKEIEVGVWPRAWCDAVACWAAENDEVDMATRIRLMTDAVSGKFYAEGFLKRTTYVFATSTAPSGMSGGEADIDLTRPDPVMGFWQRAWSTLKGWVPRVVSDESSRVLTGSLPGAAFEMAQNVTGPALEWLHRRKAESVDNVVSGGYNSSGFGGPKMHEEQQQRGPSAAEAGGGGMLTRSKTAAALAKQAAPPGDSPDVVSDMASSAQSPSETPAPPCL